MKRALLLMTLVLVLTHPTSLEDLSRLSRAHAQTGGGYDLMRYAISAGGGTSAANGYTLVGTAGQPDAGAAMTGGGFTLAGGFWGSAASRYKVYLPLIMR